MPGDGYYNGHVMIVAAAILSFARQVAEHFPVERVILFGSYAYGQPNEDSDADFLIVMPYTGKSYRAATRIRLAVDVDFPMDLIVRSPEELEQRLRMNDCFLREAVEQGITLYDAHDRRMGVEGGRRLQRRLDPAPVAKAG